MSRHLKYINIKHRGNQTRREYKCTEYFLNCVNSGVQYKVAQSRRLRSHDPGQARSGIV